MLRVLALSIRPVTGPDTRYRIEQYIAPLRAAGIDVVRHSLFSDGYYANQSRAGGAALKAWGLLAAFGRRGAEIALSSADYDAVWVGRELFPLGPPLLDRLLFARQKNVLLDIDDAIYLPDPVNTGFIHRKLRDFGKLARLAPRFKAIVCGNEFLAGYFRGKNAHVHVVPTVVPIAAYAGISRSPSAVPRIGWIGTPTNADHLEIVRAPLERLAQRHSFALRVVGVTRPLGWKNPPPVQIPWTLSHELSYFSDFDIGIMPLIDAPFVRGKCAFKLIQFMAAGIPVVASPVGSNVDVVSHGENGFLAESPEDWAQCLEKLLTDPALRHTMGAKGRETAARRYSLEGQWPRYAEIIKECV